jgi:hypothetical protein
MPQAMEIKDEVYVLEQATKIPERAVCHFCKRSMDREKLIGPFTKDKGKRSVQIIEEDEFHEPSFGLFFHEDCLSANELVKYDNAKNKWVNIATALKLIVDK